MLGAYVLHHRRLAFSVNATATLEVIHARDADVLEDEDLFHETTIAALTSALRSPSREAPMRGGDARSLTGDVHTSRDTPVMLTINDLTSLRGVTVADAEIQTSAGRQVLRLRLASGAILAISSENDELNVADETSIP